MFYSVKHIELHVIVCSVRDIYTCTCGKNKEVWKSIIMEVLPMSNCVTHLGHCCCFEQVVTTFICDIPSEAWSKLFKDFQCQTAWHIRVTDVALNDWTLPHVLHQVSS